MGLSIPGLKQMMSDSALTNLARAWWDIIQRDCPEEWSRLIPELDLSTPHRVLKPQSLEVLGYLGQISDQALPPYRELLDALVCAREFLYFGQTYTEGDFGAEFLRQYGWIKLLGPDAYWHSDTVSSGFLILGDHNFYPEHWHEAEELYLPLSGQAEWFDERQGWRLQPPGSLIHHASGVKHATRTAGEPLIALYLWRGGNLTQKSSTR